MASSNKNKEITRKDFFEYEPIQVASIVMRHIMWVNYGNLTYLDKVTWDSVEAVYIGTLNVSIQKRLAYGNGWKILEPLENAGNIILNREFQIKKMTSREEVNRKLKAEYKARGL